MCVIVPRMCPVVRHLIVLLCCCLLPVQGALAVARSVGMATHHARALEAVVLATATDTMSVTDDQLHHDHHSAHDSGHLSVIKPEKPPVIATLHSQASCTDCAKCCLTGAAAPPPAAIETRAVSFVLAAFKPRSIEVAVHVPEKPERPPRALPHPLS